MSHFSWLVCKVSLFHPLAAKQGKLVALSATRNKLCLLIGGKKHEKQSCHVPSSCVVTSFFYCYKFMLFDFCVGARDRAPCNG